MKNIKPIYLVAAGIVVLSLISYELSYEQLYKVAVSAGLPDWLAYQYGFLLEGFVSLATFTAFVARGHKLAIYPWAVALLAFAFSLWANSAGYTIPGGVARGVPVVLVPVGVHLGIVLSEAYKRAHVVELPAQIVTVEVEKIVEVPVEVPISVDTVDPAKVENPAAVAAMLNAYAAPNKASKSYHSRTLRRLIETAELPALSEAA